DVKYKTWTGAAAAADMYQLLVHCSAFDCNHAFLVYPADHFAVRNLGLAATGAAVHLFALDLRDLSNSIRQMVSVLGMGTADTLLGIHSAAAQADSNEAVKEVEQEGADEVRADGSGA